MKNARLFATLAALAVLPAPADAADPVQLKFALPAPSTSPVLKWGVEPWSKDVERDAQGTVEIKVFPGPTLGNFTNIYERTLAGVADASFGIFGPLATQFTQVNVAALPFESKNTIESSIAIWRLYDKRLIASEFDKVKVLALFTFPHSGFHANKPVRKADDIKGLKIVTSNRAMSQLVSFLGGSPVTSTPPDYYTTVSRGIADGIAVGWSAVASFKLDEVTRHHLDTESGLFTAFMLMNKDSYAKLPAPARAAIDRHSGEPFFKTMGNATDRMEREGRAATAAKAGHSIVALDPAEAERWKRLSQPIVDEWLGRTRDGARILASFREEIGKIRAGM